MRKKALGKLLYCLAVLILAGCCDTDFDPGTVKLARISNIYTIDQIDTFSKQDIDSVPAKDRIQQYEQISSTDASVIKATGKATTGISNQNGDSANLDPTFKDASTQSEINEKLGTPELAYRYSVDDFFSNYEYKTTTQLKHTYDSLIRRGYKIFFIPLRFSVNPGKTTIEDYYLEMKYAIVYDRKEMTIQIVDLFPTKLFDNRTAAYSNVVQNATALALGGEVNTPRGGGKAELDYQQLKKIHRLFSSIQREPIVISFIDDTGIDTKQAVADGYINEYDVEKKGIKNPYIIKFGWDIYPEQTLIDNELKYLQHPDNYNYLVVVAIRSHYETSPAPIIYGNYSWKKITEKSGVTEEERTEENIEWTPVILQSDYNPILNLVPVITSCQSVDTSVVKITGSDLDRIIRNPKPYENPTVKLIIDSKINTNIGQDSPISLTKLYVSSDAESAIGILKKSISEGSKISVVEYGFLRQRGTDTDTDTGIYIPKDILIKPVRPDTSQAPDAAVGKVEPGLPVGIFIMNGDINRAVKTDTPAKADSPK